MNSSTACSNAPLPLVIARVVIDNRSTDHHVVALLMIRYDLGRKRNRSMTNCPSGKRRRNSLADRRLVSSNNCRVNIALRSTSPNGENFASNPPYGSRQPMQERHQEMKLNRKLFGWRLNDIVSRNSGNLARQPEHGQAAERAQ